MIDNLIFHLNRIYRIYEQLLLRNWYKMRGNKEFNCEGVDINKHFFFIIALPRSGTAWFAKFFSTQHSYCYHELTLMQYGDLNGHQEALNKYKGLTTGSQLDKSIHRLLYMYPRFCRDMYHMLYSKKEIIAVGNSDCGAPNLVDALGYIFPTAHFLFILRNGFDTALSLEKLMKGPGAESVFVRWKKLIEDREGYLCNNLFEIACWRWLSGTQYLIKRMECIPQDKKMVVPFEKIFSDKSKIKQIWDFLLKGKVPVDQEYIEAMITNSINTGTHIKPKGRTISERWESLDREKKDCFQKIAGSFIANLSEYANWPDIDF